MYEKDGDTRRKIRINPLKESYRGLPIKGLSGLKV